MSIVRETTLLVREWIPIIFYISLSAAFILVTCLSCRRRKKRDATNQDG